MNRKFFISLSLISALLTMGYPCFAMKNEEEEKKLIKIGFNDTNEYLTTIGKLSREQYTTACKMQDSPNKAKSFGATANFLKLNMPGILDTNDPMEIEILTQLRASSLREQGIVLYKLHSQPETPLEKRIVLLEDAASVMRESYAIYTELKTLENKKEADKSLANLGIILVGLSPGKSLCANSETDPNKIIDLHLTALSLGKESYKIKKTFELEDQIKAQLMLALRQGFLVYNSIASDINIFKDPDTFQKYTALIKNIKLLENIISLFDNHLLDGPIKINWYIERDFQPKKKHTKDIFAITPAAFKGLPPVKDPETCMRLLWSTYCGLLKGASNTVSNLVGVNEQITALYKAKEKEHLDLAVKTYREKVYQGEYKTNPEKEQDSIFARLESLAENEKPLTDFYNQLRLERKERREREIAQMIREEQEKRQRLEEEKQKREAEERKVREEQAAKQRALHAEQQSSASSVSSLSVESNIQTVTSTEKITEKGVPKKDKVKTRGEAQPPVIQIIEKEIKIIETKPKVISLDPDNYYVFQCLTREINDRHITLDKVITLLVKGFKCAISPGKGDHRKATAPNNYAWTIPPAWDGPIPTIYRNELMHFLLVDMGIVEGLLEIKASK